MTGTRVLWLRSIRYRLAAAAGLLLIVAAATSAAVVGPLLIRASGQSAIRGELARATPGQYDLVVSADGNGSSPSDVAAAVSAAANAAGRQLFNAPYVALRTAESHDWTVATIGYRSVIVAPSRGCADIVLVAGRCPSKATEVLVPSGTAPRAHLVGAAIKFVDSAQSGFVVSGVYRARDDRLGILVGGGSAPILTSQAGMTRIGNATTQIARVSLRPNRIGLDELAATTRRIANVRVTAIVQQIPIGIDSALPELFTSTRDQLRVATVLALLTVVPTVLLSWYALVLIMQLIASVRAPEWALGRLRGLPLPAWMRSLYAEPVALLLAGTVLGTAVGVLAASLVRNATMATGVDLELLRAPVLVSLGGTVLGAALGIAMATSRGLRMPLAALLQESAEPTRVSRTAAAAQVLLVAVTVLSAVQLRTQSQVSVGAQNLGLLLPGLLAMIVALFAIRVGTSLVRRSSGSAPRSIGVLVLGRRLARSPGLLWRHSVIAVAAALIVFALQILVLMNRNVSVRAGNQVGAERVVHVRTVTTARLLAATRDVDPSGRYAMAAEELVGAGTGGTTRVVAVDSGRLAAVSAWRAAWAGHSSADLARLLAPAHGPSVVVRGSEITLNFSAVSLTTDSNDATDPLATTVPPRPTVTVVVQRGSTWQTVPLGRLTLQTRALSGPIDCASGCILRKIEFDNQTDITFAGTLTITHLRTDRQPASDFDSVLRRTTAWRNDLTLAEPGLPTAATPALAPDGLGLQIRDLVGQGSPAVVPNDGPSPVPAVLARGTEASLLSGFRNVVDGSGLNKQDVPMRVVARAAALPRSIDDGALVDLTYLQRLSDPSLNESVSEVWLAPNAPRSVLKALHKHGLTVTSIETRGAAQGLLRSAAPVRAVVANIAVVVLLGLLAATALGAGIAIDSGRRRQHLRVLRDAGLDARVIRRYAVRELTLPAGAAIVVGTVCALVSLLAAGPRLPLFGDPAGPPLDTTPNWPVLALTFVSMLVLVVGAALGLAWSEYRAAVRPARWTRR